MAEMAFVGVLRVWKIVASKWITVISVDSPIKPLIREPPKSAGTGEDLDVIVQMSLRRSGERKRAIRHRHCRNRREPRVAYYIASQGRQSSPVFRKKGCCAI